MSRDSNGLVSEKERQILKIQLKIKLLSILSTTVADDDYIEQLRHLQLTRLYFKTFEEYPPISIIPPILH